MATLHRAIGLCALSFASVASCNSDSPDGVVGSGAAGGANTGGSGGAGGTELVDELSGFIPITPYRHVDTRDTSPISAGDRRCWSVASEGEPIPENAVAVAVNLVAVAPEAPGSLSAFPLDLAGGTVPEIATLAYEAARTVANGALVPVGDDGSLCVQSSATTHVIIDVAGYFEHPDGFTPVPPFQHVTTEFAGPLEAETSRCWQVGGQNDIPDDAAAVLVHVTASSPQASGYLAAYAAGAGTVPMISTLSYDAGQRVGSAAVVAVGEGGDLCVYSSAESDVTIDVHGYFGARSSFTAIDPLRAVDTEPDSVPLRGSTRCFPVAGEGDVPGTASAVALSVTAANPREVGFLLVRPAGEAGIPTSTINFAEGESRSNLALVEPGAFGRICVFAARSTDYLVDVVGYWPGDVDRDPIDHPHTFSVTTAVELMSSLEKASDGDLLEIDPDAQIELTGHKDVSIPASITIRGGRSDGVAGALLRSLEQYQLPPYGTWNLFRTAGPGIVIEDLRLEGPDGTSALGFMAGAITIGHDDVVIRNSELYHWPAHAVATSGDDTVIENNDIHDNIRAGRGYGVVVGATGTPTIIRNNVFRRNRHSVAGNGYGSYAVHHNLFGTSAFQGVLPLVDMHGVNEHLLDNSTHQAGIDIHIHHNDFEYADTAISFIDIRGIPVNTAIIEDNCVSRTDVAWVRQSDMSAYPSNQPGLVCYEKSSTWLCHTPAYGSNMTNILVRNNQMGVSTGCR